MDIKFEQKKFNKSKSFKPVTKTLPLVFIGKDNRGNEYDVDSCRELIADLQNSGCFDKLSVGITIARNLIVNEDAKGVTTVARFLEFDTQTEDVQILVMGKNAAFAEKMDDMVIIPRVRIEKDSTIVSAILGFELVPAMEA